MKLKLKRSNVLESGSAKAPTPSQLDYGELAVNYNTQDPSIFLKDSDDNIVNIIDTVILPSVGNGGLTIQSYGSLDSSSGTFTANQSGDSSIILPQISYTDLKDIPPDAAAPGNGTITITQPGTSAQTFTVNQSGDTAIALKNDNTVYTAGDGLSLSGISFLVDSSVVRTTGTQSIGGAKTFTSNLSVTGAITASGDVTAFSDISLKENIQVIPDALNKVSSIRGVTYNRTDTEDKRRQSGVIAQEVESVLPEVVHTNQDGIKSVAYGNLVGLLIESIKELKAEVEALKAECN